MILLLPWNNFDQLMMSDDPLSLSLSLSRIILCVIVCVCVCEKVQTWFSVFLGCEVFIIDVMTYDRDREYTYIYIGFLFITLLD